VPLAVLHQPLPPLLKANGKLALQGRRPKLTQLLSFWELGKTNNFMMSLFPTIITKEILGRNVAYCGQDCHSSCKKVGWV
jgi:hypothetical protein